MKIAILATLLCSLASFAAAQSLLLPKPELRTVKDCEDCPELVILPDGALMSRAPITRDEFSVFAKETGYRHKGWGCVWHKPPFDQEGNHPAVCITFESASLYVEWLSKKTGYEYRLPTVEELMTAVMGFSSENYWWGEQIGKGRANCLLCGSEYDAKGTSPVNAFPANPFNLLDAVGNVWIWTQDCLSAACEERILLTGGWSSPPSDLRITKRISNQPKIPFNSYGMRVMREEVE
jgi:formylglycine-generating enzyme required for sulfatase activity